MSRPIRFSNSATLQALLWAISLSYGFADWVVYRNSLLLHPNWQVRLQGGVQAPFQYRIGNWLVVDWLYRLSHIKPYDTLTLIDVLCLAFALWAILRVLERSEHFQTAPPAVRWLAIAALFVQVEYYLPWGHVFQEAATMPSILFVALSMMLMYGWTYGLKRRSKDLAAFLLVALSCVQGFFRADVAVILHAGCLLAIVFNRKTIVPLGRRRQAIASLLAAFAAGCIQLYLMLIRFPNAKYGADGVLRLASNLHPGMWLVMLLALVPYWLLLSLIALRRTPLDGPEAMVITASLLYFVLWAAVGLLDEVRIFFPFAFALMPATVRALIGFLQQTRLQPSPTSPRPGHPWLGSS